MVPLSVVKEQYQQMSDDALQAFAANEADKLTIESFHLLKEEFERRNLDLNIFNEVDLDRSLSALGKQNAVEKAAENEYVESVWEFAMGEKEAGKRNVDIYNSLLKKGVNEPYAFMLIQSLGTRVRELKEHAQAQLMWGWVLAGSGFVMLSLGITGSLSGFFVLYGFVVTCGGGFRIYQNQSRKTRFEKIEQNILLEGGEPEPVPEDELTGNWEHGLADVSGSNASWGWSFLFNNNGTGVYRFWSESRLQDETPFLWERIGENLIKAKYNDDNGWYVVRYSISMAEKPGGGNLWKLTNESYRPEKAGEDGFWTDIEALYKPVPGY